jgi:hypothetical protein
MGARAFLERAEREGVNFFDWRRDSLFGEKAPDTREEEAAELARRKAEREAEEAWIATMGSRQQLLQHVAATVMAATRQGLTHAEKGTRCAYI